MKKRILEKQQKKKMRTRDRLLSKIMHLSWVRLEERIPEVHRNEEEEHSPLFKNF